MDPYRYAVEGNAEKLREVLQRRPQLVNALSPTTHQTFLFTVIQNEHRLQISVGSVENNPSRNKYYVCASLLVEEFQADVNVANGGTAATALHLAAQLGLKDFVLLLLQHGGDVTKLNIFGETPLQMAEREKKWDCVALLREAAEQRQNNKDKKVDISRFKVEDSSDDEKQNNNNNTNHTITAPSPDTQTGGTSETASPITVNTPLHNNQNNNTNNSNNIQQKSMSLYIPRNEILLRTDIPFHNSDLNNFKTLFGNGFSFFQCAQYYEIDGLLGYRYKGNQYHTPVLIRVCGRSNNRNNTSLSAETFRQFVSANSGPTQNNTTMHRDPSSTSSVFSSSPQGSQLNPDHPHTNQHNKVVIHNPRYKVLINFAKSSDFNINKKAEYMDPISGAILTHPLDQYYYDDLVSYIKEVVVCNFERVPPMTTRESHYGFKKSELTIKNCGTGEDNFKYHHSSTAPPYFKNIFHLSENNKNNNNVKSVNSGSRSHFDKVRHYQIYKELSLFGDGLFKYIHQNNNNNNAKMIVGYIPIYRETALEELMKTLYHTNNANNNNNNTKNSVAIDVETIMTVRVKIVFQPTQNNTNNNKIEYENSFFAQHPNVYLVDAALFQTHNANHNKTWEAFAPLLAPQSKDGRVSREALQASYENWENQNNNNNKKEKESHLLLYSLLMLLQKKLTTSLENYAASCNHHSAVRSAVMGSPNTQNNNTNTILDEFFASDSIATTTTSNNNSPSTIPNNNNNNTQMNKDKCVLCHQKIKSVVLHPCSHLFLCSVCFDAYCQHHREKIFDCFICKKRVEGASEIIFRK